MDTSLPAPSAAESSILWTEKDAAGRLKLTIKTLFNYRKKGLISFVQLGAGKGGDIRYRDSDLLDFIGRHHRPKTA